MRTHSPLLRMCWGLRFRTVGEHPRAADTLAICVPRTRCLFVVISGMLSSLGGAFLPIGQLQTFLEGMSAGPGFVALAALVLGKRMPSGTMIAALLFGCPQAATVRTPALNYHASPQLLSMFAHLLTWLTFVGLVG